MRRCRNAPWSGRTTAISRIRRSGCTTRRRRRYSPSSARGTPVAGGRPATGQPCRAERLLARIEAALAIPTCIMESPRGFNDATLGAFAEVARRTDLIILLGKAFDFTLRFGGPADRSGVPVHFDRSGRRSRCAQPHVNWALAWRSAVSRIQFRRRKLCCGSAPMRCQAAADGLTEARIADGRPSGFMEQHQIDDER